MSNKFVIEIIGANGIPTNAWPRVARIFGAKVSVAPYEAAVSNAQAEFRKALDDERSKQLAASLLKAQELERQVGYRDNRIALLEQLVGECVQKIGLVNNELNRERSKETTAFMDDVLFQARKQK